MGTLQRRRMQCNAADELFMKPSNKIKKDRQEGLRNLDGKVKRLIHERNNAGFNKRV